MLLFVFVLDNNKQHKNQIAVCSKIVGSIPVAAKIFSFMFKLEKKLMVPRLA